MGILVISPGPVIKVGRASDYDDPDIDLMLLILVGWGRSFLSVAWSIGFQLVFVFCSGFSVSYLAPTESVSPRCDSLLNL